MVRIDRLKVSQMRAGAIAAWAVLGLLWAITAVLAVVTAAVAKILGGIAEIGCAACVHVRTMPKSARPDLLTAGGAS